MYPSNMTKLYSNFTPRGNKYLPEATEGAVVFGIQYFHQEVSHRGFQNECFFNLPEEVVIEHLSEFHCLAREVNLVRSILSRSSSYKQILCRKQKTGSMCLLNILLFRNKWKMNEICVVDDFHNTLSKCTAIGVNAIHPSNIEVMFNPKTYQA